MGFCSHPCFHTCLLETRGQRGHLCGLDSQGIFADGSGKPRPHRGGRMTTDPVRALSGASDSAPALTRLAAIVESSDDAIVTKTLEGVVTSWNPGAERIFAYTAAEMIGRPITTIIPANLVDEESEFLRRLARGEHIDHYEPTRLRKDGHAIDVSVTLPPLRDATGPSSGSRRLRA